MPRLREVSVLLGMLAATVLLLSVTAMAKTEIDFWSSGGPQVRAGLERIIEEYEAQNADVTVKLTMFSTWPDMHRRILLGLAGGDPPDAARMKPLTAGDLASKGAIEPLTPYLEKDGIDPYEFADALIDKSSKYEGTMYVLPMSASLPILYYNVDLFNEAGLDVNTPPDTWDDLVTYGQKLTQSTKARWGYLPQGVPYGYMMNLWQSGGQYLSDDLRKPMFNSETGLEALQWRLDMMHKYKITPTLQMWDDQEILTGNVGMWERALSGLSFYRVNAPDLEWKTARLAKNVRRTSMEMSEGSIIFSGANNKQEAWEWIKFLSMDPEAGRIFYDEYGQLPTTKKVLQNEYFQSDPLVGPPIWHLLNDLEARPVMPQAQELFDVLTEEVDQALYQRKSPEEALAAAAKKSQEIINKIDW